MLADGLRRGMCDAVCPGRGVHPGDEQIEPRVGIRGPEPGLLGTGDAHDLLDFAILREAVVVRDGLVQPAADPCCGVERDEGALARFAA